MGWYSVVGSIVNRGRILSNMFLTKPEADAEAEAEIDIVEKYAVELGDACGRSGRFVWW